MTEFDSTSIYILIKLNSNGGKLSRLQERSLATNTTLFDMAVRELDKHGYITREAEISAGDRPVDIIKITESGVRLIGLTAGALR